MDFSTKRQDVEPSTFNAYLDALLTINMDNKELSHKLAEEYAELSEAYDNWKHDASKPNYKLMMDEIADVYNLFMLAKMRNLYFNDWMTAGTMDCAKAILTVVCNEEKVSIPEHALPVLGFYKMLIHCLYTRDYKRLELLLRRINLFIPNGD